MPLDTSTYSLALLRLDGRRWSELRSLTANISTQPSADGSSTLEMGNTKVLCTIFGPSEPKITSRVGGGAGDALVTVEIVMAGFSSVDRQKRGRNDKRITELQTTIASAFSSAIFTALYPHSTITISLTVLSNDGSLLACLINAATLAIVDAGIPMKDYICACTAGSTSSYASNEEKADPLLDLNLTEEQELPFLTVATIGASDKIAVLLMETRVQATRLEGMLAVGVDGCAKIRSLLDRVVRARGRQVLDP